MARPTAKVTILDSGYIWVDPDQLDPSHRNLDDRVTVVQGQWLDTTTGTWKHDRPDGLYTDSAGQLDGISGHGTFIAGLISNIAPHTRLEVVGLRNQEVEIGPLTRRKQLGLFETEVAIAHAMLRRCDTDVIQCGFAFPTLDDYPSVVFAAVMEELRASHAPHGGRVAVVAPAGNERSTPQVLAGGAPRGDRRRIDEPSRKRPGVVLELGRLVRLLRPRRLRLLDLRALGWSGRGRVARRDRAFPRMGEVGWNILLRAEGVGSDRRRVRRGRPRRATG